MRVEAALLLLPMLAALAYRENTVLAFAVPALLLGLVGTLLARTRPPRTNFYAREGFLIVAVSWIVLSVFGALPFVISGEIPHFIDAFFETVSGFTTTGASILQDVERLSHGMLFWRSFTHWVGGMGVLVFVLAILPKSSDGAIYLMRAEVPGPTVGKLVSKVKLTARILYGIYVVMTVIEIVLLCAGGMPLFDSVVHSFGTAGTGGFGIKNASIAYYDSAYIDGVITVFMILFGINFNLFYFILSGNILRALKSEELRWYLLIILGAILLITANIMPLYGGFFHTLRYAAFQVASIITTTGFSTTDFNLWPAFSHCILLTLMFFGACAGSTGGGIKIARIIMLVKNARYEVLHLFRTRSVKVVKFEGERVDVETGDALYAYLIAYILLFGASVLLLSLQGFDFLTNFSAVAACINNIGPGLSIVGPTGNYSNFSVFNKLLLSFDMLAGRLEIFPMLMLFTPSAWRAK